MDANLVVIGLDCRSSPREVRDRFCISAEEGREAALALRASPGVTEVVVLATRTRTEYILWASDFSAAAQSVLSFLASKFEMKLCEWKFFYRLLDDRALTHLFRGASGLDEGAAEEPEILERLKSALETGRSAGVCGRFLETTLDKVIRTGEQLRGEIGRAPAAPEKQAAACRIVAQEVHALAGKLRAQSVVPAIVALRLAVEDAIDAEIELYRRDHGPLEAEGEHVLHELPARLVQRLAALVGRELKGSDGSEQQLLTQAILRVFHPPLAPEPEDGEKSMA